MRNANHMECCFVFRKKKRKYIHNMWENTCFFLCIVIAQFRSPFYENLNSMLLNRNKIHDVEYLSKNEKRFKKWVGFEITENHISAQFIRNVMIKWIASFKALCNPNPDPNRNRIMHTYKNGKFVAISLRVRQLCSFFTCQRRFQGFESINEVVVDRVCYVGSAL